MSNNKGKQKRNKKYTRDMHVYKRVKKPSGKSGNALIQFIYHVREYEQEHINKTFMWGIVYLTIIPVYAVIYMLMGEETFDYGSMNKSVLSCVYLSISSVTTLGIGDISPLTDIAAFLIGSECAIGVIVIGLFLNSLSFLKAQQLSHLQRKKAALEKYDYECKKMLQFAKVIEITADKYADSILAMLSKKYTSLDMVNKSLPIRSMTHLFDDSYQRETLSLPYTRIYHFFVLNDNMVRLVKEIIREINMEYWPEFENRCLKYLELMSDIRVEEFFSTLESDKKTMAEWTKLAEQIKLMPDEDAAEAIKSTPFAVIHNMLIEGAGFINDFKSSVRMIRILDPEKVIGDDV